MRLDVCAVNSKKDLSHQSKPRNYSLTCKRWNTIASDPQLVTPPKSSEYFSYMAQVAEQSERYQGLWHLKLESVLT